MKKVNLGIVITIAVVVVFVFVGGMGIFNSLTNSEQMDQNQVKSSRLIKKDIIVGTGVEAVNGSTVTVHYTGVFENGTKFDSSRDRGEPFSFELGKGMVIAGWDQGVLGMKVGGKRNLIIPSDLAYGPNDYGPIPGGSTLMFEVELLDVK
jgi:FKBP-type peptidyl-prolyl cis-trans isomerase